MRQNCIWNESNDKCYECENENIAPSLFIFRDHIRWNFVHALALAIRFGCQSKYIFCFGSCVRVAWEIFRNMKNAIERSQYWEKGLQKTNVQMQFSINLTRFICLEGAFFTYVSFVSRFSSILILFFYLGLSWNLDNSPSCWFICGSMQRLYHWNHCLVWTISIPYFAKCNLWF